ncbi:DeoR/GlpR family DNA-binding transcription regulator [Mesorhizobium sp. M0204]|uniref:DeoR/GlpR family DNA-binding transcription regulator n=1 Tax=Mesorhizobium sp. M0204 TaxID=2956913 RepID=UPI003336CE49
MSENDPRRLRKRERQDRILSALNVNSALRIQQLSDNLGVSTETIRRDLSELHDLRRIDRTYGGAVYRHRFEPALAERLLLNVHERQAIALRAVELVGEADAFMVGGGATALHFARALRGAGDAATVITPAFGVAIELSENSAIEALMLPGIYHPREGLVHGPETLAMIRRYRVQVAVIGASALDASGVSEAMLSAGAIYSEMMACAERTLILADHTKFGRRALTLVGPWHANVTLICDRAPDADLAVAIAENGAEIEIATSHLPAVS